MKLLEPFGLAGSFGGRHACNRLAPHRMISYQVFSPIVGLVRSSTGSRQIVEITPGELVAVPKNAPHKGVIEVTHRGQRVNINIRDVLRRAKPIGPDP